MSDSLMRMLAELPSAEPDADRAERIRRRCRARLARQAAPAPGPTIPFTPVWRLFVSLLGAAYLVGAIVEAARAYRVF